MTKLEKNKQKIIDDLNINPKLKIDKWGNYHYITNPNIRYHLKKSVMRKEQKINGQWCLISTEYYKDIVKRL